jgi:hypothetical protein
MAASLRALFSHRERLPVRPERCLPAERSLPGHCPAHDASWRDDGKTCLSGAISARIVSAVRRLNTGDAHEQFSGRCERGDLLFDRVGQSVDLRIGEVEVRRSRCGRFRQPWQQVVTGDVAFFAVGADQHRAARGAIRICHKVQPKAPEPVRCEATSSASSPEFLR